MDNKAKGKKGEEIAQKHYEAAGFEILETNYRTGRLEVDFIALQEERLLAFVEVKMRGSRGFGEPETFVSEKQQERIQSAAEEYIFGINWKGDIRFDIVCVDKKGELEIFEDAF